MKAPIISCYRVSEFPSILVFDCLDSRRLESLKQIMSPHRSTGFSFQETRTDTTVKSRGHFGGNNAPKLRPDRRLTHFQLGETAAEI